MADGTLKNLAISVGFNTAKFAQDIQAAGAMLDSGFRNAAEGVKEGMGNSLDAVRNFGQQAAAEIHNATDRMGEGFRQAAETAREGVSAGLQAMHELGQRTSEEIQAAIDKTRAAYQKIREDASLTDRDKAVGLAKAMEQIRRLEMELQRGLPQAAQRGFGNAGMAVNRFGGMIRSIWAQVAGPLAGVFAIGGSISQYISKSTEAGNLAEELKVDVEELQAWSGAVERAGGSSESLRQTIQKLTASGKANGDAFGVLYDLAEKSQKMSKETFVQKAKELEIDEKTIEVLYKGRKELDENLKRQYELGVYTKQDAENSKKFKQAISDLGQAFTSFISFIGRAAVPIMQKLADILTEIVLFARQHTSFIVIAATAIGAALALKMLPPLKQIPQYISKAWLAFKKWAPIVAILTVIVLLLDDFYTYLVGGESELEEFWKIFGTGPEIMAALTKAWQDLKTWMWECLEGGARKIKRLWQVLDNWGIIENLKKAFLGLGHVIHGLLTDDTQEAIDGATQIWEGLVDIISTIAERAAKAIWEKITGVFERLLNWIKETFTWDNILGGMGEIGKAMAAGMGYDVDEDMDTREEAKKIAPKKKTKEEAKRDERAAWEAADEGMESFGVNMQKAAEAADAAMLDTAETAKAGLEAAAKDSGATWIRESTSAAIEAGAAFVRESQAAAVQIGNIFNSLFGGISAQIGTLATGATMMAAGPMGMMVPAAAGVRAANASGTVNNNNSSVNINNMTVNTRATDANGMARGVKGALQKSQIVQSVQSGTVAKG